MGVLDMLENLKENKWNGGMKTKGGNFAAREIMQTNINIVHMNKGIVDMSQELMKINWANGFNLTEEKCLISEKLNYNSNISHESQTVAEVHSDVIEMNKDILQMNNDIMEMNKTFTPEQKNNKTKILNDTNVKILNEFTKTKKFENCEKENIPLKTENQARNLIKFLDFQEANNQEKREQLEFIKKINKEGSRQTKTDDQFVAKTEEKKPETRRDIKKDVEIILRNKKSANTTLLDVVKDKQEGDMFIVNTDHELTDTIKKTFEGHGCQVIVSRLETDLIALYILLNKKISIKKLRKLMERGKKFGLEFFLTKTGMTASLFTKVHKIFKW